jgi:hypothetical protein
MKDCLDQDLNVGDVVVQANCSYIPKPQVITRLGATTKVQLNGNSYVESSWLVKINEQYVVAKSLNEYNNLVSNQNHNFNYTPVQDKPAPTKYLVLQVGEYATYVANQKVISPKRYFVCSITGKTVGDYNEDYRTKRVELDALGNNIQAFGLCSSRYDDNKQYMFKHFDWSYLLSKRALTELGLDAFIDTDYKEFDIEILKQKLGCSLRL